MTNLKTNSDFNSPPATPTGPFAATPETGTNDGELRKLLTRLTTGEDALAKRKDLTELHKRIVTMFTTLNQGLVDTQAAKAQEDRAQLVQRLDQVERAVNSMEGALRIELEPLILNIVTAAATKIGGDTRKNKSHPILLGIGFCAAIGFGVYFSKPISTLARQTLPATNAAYLENSTTPPLIGGSALAENRMK